MATTRAAAKRRPVKRAKAVDAPLPIRITHPERVIWESPRLTKGDLATYYQQVSDWILPHVAGRPLSLLRCPDGLSGRCFFQKHPPAGMPQVVKRVAIQEKGGEAEYLVIDNAVGLLTLVQFGIVEIHPWGSRADKLEQPDRMIFDLDPDPAVPWKRVAESARIVREALADLGLESFVKTSGGKGLHVVAPLARRNEWPLVKEFARLLVTHLAAAMPAQFVATMAKSARRGRIFIDYLRNDRGSTAVAAYSARARQGAGVSTPISWQELAKLSGGGDFTIESLPSRLAKLRKDPWAGFDDVRQTIGNSVKRVKNV